MRRISLSLSLSFSIYIYTSVDLRMSVLVLDAAEVTDAEFSGAVIASSTSFFEWFL